MYIIVYLSISTCVLEQKTLKTRKKFSKFRKQSRLGREKVSKIKSTSNTNFEKAPISRKQTIFRIEIHYYRISCCPMVALLWSNNQGSADNKILNTDRGGGLKFIIWSNWWPPYTTEDGNFVIAIFFRRSKIKLWNSELGNCSKH